VIVLSLSKADVTSLDVQLLPISGFKLLHFLIRIPLSPIFFRLPLVKMLILVERTCNIW